jgi:large subunit ribosomal protein L13e
LHHIKPMIVSQTGKRRSGKGFSPDEIKEAGLNNGDVRKLGIPVDRKRRTSREENIETLKAHSEKTQTAKSKSPIAAIKKKPKK